MSREGGDFLSRWSRRKLEVRQAEPEAGLAPVDTSEPVDGPGPERAPDDPGLTPEEIAALPKIDDLTPETDIRVFLQKGVPELLKNAALRRMWALDPAIRDYVSEAREYAYDWNVPGGVPGNGPLLPSDNVEEMLGQIFGDRPRVAKLLADEQVVTAAPTTDRSIDDDQVDTATDLPEENVALQQSEPAASPDSAAPLGSTETTGVQSTRSPAIPDHAAAPSNQGGDGVENVPRRRHGGAIPV